LDNPNYGVTNFDAFFSSCLMVWQIITLEGWTDCMYKVEQTSGAITNIYFLIVVLIGAFFLVNLTLAVITIFFMQSQDDSRNKQEEMKAKSQAEL